MYRIGFWLLLIVIGIWLIFPKDRGDHESQSNPSNLPTRESKLSINGVWLVKVDGLPWDAPTDTVFKQIGSLYWQIRLIGKQELNIAQWPNSQESSFSAAFQSIRISDLVFSSQRIEFKQIHPYQSYEHFVLNDISPERMIGDYEIFGMSIDGRQKRFKGTLVLTKCRPEEYPF